MTDAALTPTPPSAPLAGSLWLSDRGEYLRVARVGTARDGTPEYVLESEWAGDWAHYGALTAAEFTRRRYLPVTEDRAGLEAAALAAFVAGDWDTPAGAEASEAGGSVLIPAGDAQRLADRAAALAAAETRAILIRRIVERRLHALQAAERRLAEQLRYAHAALRALELYLGYDLDLQVVSSGPRADPAEPVHFFQRVLYMDEEVGICEALAGGQLGIDFQSVTEFDAWLAADPDHLAAVCPTPKCVVALQPSRQDRQYSANPWLNWRYQAQNGETHLLIRNGACAWRVATNDSVTFRVGGGGALFPTAEHMTEWAHRHTLDGELQARTVALLLQGICDRTDLLQPLPAAINLLDPAAYEAGHFRLVRDAEDVLGPGRAPWRAFQQALNRSLTRGSRVVVGAIPPGYRDDAWLRSRVLQNMHYVPGPPPPGLYQVDQVRDRLVIRYNPGDTVYGGWGEYDPHPRQVRLTFAIEATDTWLLHYDALDLADITFYLTNRVDRRSYQTMLPLLAELHRQRTAELAWEAAFVQLVAGRLDCPAARVWDAVTWWKYKVLWKRPLREDDAKALRMIEDRVRRQLGAARDR